MLTPGFTIYSRTWEEMKRTNCLYCNKQLDPHQAASSGICGGAACHARMIEKVGADLIERKRRENAAYAKRMRALVDDEMTRALTVLDAAEEEIAFVVLPWQGKPVEPLPEERRQAFLEHLKLITDRAFLEPVPDDDLSYRANSEMDEPPIMNAACTSCQGGCCALGGNTGFLHDVDVQRHRQRNPETTAPEAIEFFLSFLPETSTRDACIYQSETGCNLPRAHRNDQCNTFYCKSLRRLQETYGQTGEGKAVLVAADDGEARSIAAFDPASGRQVIATFEPGERGAEEEAAPVETITISSEDYLPPS